MMRSVKDYKFPKWDYPVYFSQLYKTIGPKAFYQQLNRPHRRYGSRKIIKDHAPLGIGLEIGVGAKTIAPLKRTILSDGHHGHGQHDSMAQVFFPADAIPYEDNTFSFVLSEHVLEHVGNPLKCLKEWQRVIEVGAVIILILPHKERNNDKFRQRTSLSHLIEDEVNNTNDQDETHFDDWWENVVKKGLMPDHYKHIPREKLISSGSIHHHVWTEADIEEVFRYIGLKIVKTYPRLWDRRDSFCVVGQKV